MDISKLSIKDTMEETTTYMYTGTSCINSGSIHPSIAICICTNEDEDQTLIEYLGSEFSTIHKAELHAIYRALSMIDNEVNIVIVSRSDYAVKCINVWSSTWRQDNWSKTPKNSKANIDLITDIEGIISTHSQNKKSISIIHSSNMPNSTGNKIAHGLARHFILKYP